MATFDAGQPTFGLRACKIATNDLAGGFGSPVTVPSIKVLSINYKTVSGKLEGDDGITAQAAIATEAEIMLQFGGITLDAYAVLTGLTNTQSGAGAALQHSMKFNNVVFPYFAVIGQAYAVQGGGDTHIFVPKLKIMDGFELKMEFGQFVIPSVKCAAVLDPNWNGIFSVYEHTTATSPVIPPI